MGATKVTRAGDLKAAWELAARYDQLVLAEEFVEGEELTGPFLGDQALPLVRIVAPDGNYDYQHKYFTDDTQYFCPAGLPDVLEQRMREAVLQSARVLGCRGWGRADLILRVDGSFTLLEMNTAPGMTSHSLVPMSARAAGLEFGALCLRILEEARVG